MLCFRQPREPLAKSHLIAIVVKPEKIRGAVTCGVASVERRDQVHCGHPMPRRLDPKSSVPRNNPVSNADPPLSGNVFWFRKRDADDCCRTIETEGLDPPLEIDNSAVS